MQLEMMESRNVTKSILSITSPGTHLVADDDILAEQTRYCNDYAADMKRRRPAQFGFFASLPIPDVEASLGEIERVSKNLDADGYVLLTNYNGTYLGNEKLKPVFAELNRQKVTVLIHPTLPCIVVNGTYSKMTPMSNLPRPVFEFMLDTSRAIIDLFLSSTIPRCPNITFIIPHVGSYFTLLIRRFSTIPQLSDLPDCNRHVNPDWVKELLNIQFYFHTAGWSFPELIHGLLEWVTVEGLLYESDFPFTPLTGVQALSQDHDLYSKTVFPSVEDQRKLCSDNARKLLSLSSTST